MSTTSIVKDIFKTAYNCALAEITFPYTNQTLNMAYKEGEPGDNLETRLQKIILDDGETLAIELATLKKKLEWTKKPVLTVNIIVPNPSKFREFTDMISEYFPGSIILECTSTGIQQYDEIKKILSEHTGIVIAVDAVTRTIVPYNGWLHSQDQGIKEGRSDLRKIFEEKNAHVILVRYFDSSDQKQLTAAIAPNDFLDVQIKSTSVS